MAASKKPRMKKKANQLNTCCVAFGSNIISRYGHPLQTVCHAMKEIQTSQFKLTSMSSLYETVAYPESSGPNFINGCAQGKGQIQSYKGKTYNGSFIDFKFYPEK